MNWCAIALCLLSVPFTAAATSATRPITQFVEVSPDHRGFILKPSGTKFIPWGFNYDRDSAGHLLEDYWISEWPRVVGDFQEMKRLGANVVRVHLQ